MVYQKSIKKCTVCGRECNTNFCEHCGGKVEEFVVKQESINPCDNMQNSNGQQYKQSQQNVQYNNIDMYEPEGFVKVWIVVVLTIVTLGIYGFIWIYRTVGLLNKKLPYSQQDSQAIQVVLCIFVPFYVIYWVYRNCKRVEEYSRTTGLRASDLSLIGLLLTIFGFGIVAYALMQDQINKNLLFENGIITNPEPIESYQHVNQKPQNTTSTHEMNVASENVIKEAETVKESAAISLEEIQLLKQLKELLDAGILTNEEFDNKKKELLNKIK